MQTLTAEEFQNVRNAVAAKGTARGWSRPEQAMALRTETHEALQARNEMPRDEHVTDAHKIAFHDAKRSDPRLEDALHMMQKRHSSELWVETDRLVSTHGGL